MHIRAMPAAYTQALPLPSESAKRTRAPELQDQIDALQQESQQSGSATTANPAADAVQQERADSSASMPRTDGSLVPSTSDNLAAGSLAAGNGRLVDVMA